MIHFLYICLCLTGTLFADFKVGDTLPTINLSDQFGHEQKVGSKDRLILMTFEKDTSLALNDYLKIQSTSFLTRHHSKYISDISSMPSFLASMFALPKMKKYPFSILLIKDDFGKYFNRSEGKITVFKLKDHKIIAIEFVLPEALSTLFIN